MGPLLPMDSCTCPKQVTGGLHPPTPPDVLPASPCMGAVAGCQGLHVVHLLSGGSVPGPQPPEPTLALSS